MCMHVCFKLKIIMEPNQEFSRVVMLGINHIFPGDGFNNQSLWQHIGPRLLLKVPSEAMDTSFFSLLEVSAPSEDLVSLL